MHIVAFKIKLIHNKYYVVNVAVSLNLTLKHEENFKNIEKVPEYKTVFIFLFAVSKMFSHRWNTFDICFRGRSIATSLVSIFR